MRRIVCVALAFGTILAGSANAEDDATTATEPQAGSDIPIIADVPPAESLNWTVLTRDIEAQPPTPRRTRSGTSSADASPTPTWKRVDHRDGSAAVTVNRKLYTNWDGKLGADFKLAKPSTVPTGSVDPVTLLPGTSPGASTGTAWVSAPAPALDLPLGWDKAAVEARVDPANDQGKVGLSLSKSVQLSQQLALSLQGGISAQESLRTLSGPTAAAPLPSYTVDRFVRLTVPRTGTSIAVGRTSSASDDRSLHRLSAEQKLFGDVNIAGSLSETTTGSFNQSIVARFRRTW